MDQTETEISEYEAQLAQVRLAAAALPESQEKKKLEALEADLLEIISLSKNTAGKLKNDPLSEQYNIFKAELEELNRATHENSKNSDPQTSNNQVGNWDLREDLEGLKGTKCQAPFTYKWTNDVTYYNAFITHVPEPDEVNEYDGIHVKVMFTNPTHKEMLPCPYYLEGKCRFSDENCRYSHGELVLLNSLKEYRCGPIDCINVDICQHLSGECFHSPVVVPYNNMFISAYDKCIVFGQWVYVPLEKESSKFEEKGEFGRSREPDFSKLCSGCNVLAKQDDGLWYRANVVTVNEAQCTLKFESNSREEQVLFHNILPLDNSDSCEGNTTSDEENDIVGSVHEDNDEDLVRRILSAPPSSALGEWEKFTKGFGSKIMAKMGYIHGSGLGKNGMGRVEPVPAVILPAGKSLDHCMMLRERAGNYRDLFKAERKLKHLQKKHDEKIKKSYESEKKKTDIFTFLNTTLHPSQISEPPKVNVKNQFRNESTRNLNVTSLQISEELRKLEKEIRSLNQSLTKHVPHTHGYNVIKEKLTFKENKLLQLHTSERRIKNEQDQRRDREKLTIF